MERLIAPVLDASRRIRSAGMQRAAFPLLGVDVVVVRDFVGIVTPFVGTASFNKHHDPVCCPSYTGSLMDISVSRPKVAQLTFQVLGRSVHPELFQTFKTRRINRDAYQVVSHITSDGHVVACTRRGVTLTEIAASSFQLLPEGPRLVSQPMVGSHKQEIEYSDDIRYEFEFELERVPSEMFWMIQKQLGESRKNHEMIQEFGASGRIAIGGLSFVNIETRLSSFRVQAIHTFPDDLTLLKTQSVFRFGKT